jgi:acylphosphatase
MESEKLKHFSLTVHGLVQGVFFRKSTRDKAIELGIAGFVLNKPDGSVYIEAEASETILKEFLVWCYQGPPGAIVENIDVKPGEIKNFTEFRIK